MDGNNYICGYSERGKREIEKIFNNKEEAVKYVMKQISEGKVSNEHLAARTWSEEDIEQAEKELQEILFLFSEMISRTLTEELPIEYLSME